MGGEDRVDATGREIEIVLLRGLVLTDGDRVLEILLQELGVHGGGLDAYGLAFQNRLPLLDHRLGGGRILVEAEPLALAGELGDRRVLHRAPAMEAGGVGPR